MFMMQMQQLQLFGLAFIFDGYYKSPTACYSLGSFDFTVTEYLFPVCWHIKKECYVALNVSNLWNVCSCNIFEVRVSLKLAQLLGHGCGITSFCVKRIGYVNFGGDIYVDIRLS